MKTFENLWREYVRAEYGTSPPPVEQLASQRRAFFTGAWSQLIFSRKINGLDPVLAQAVNRKLEVELAGAVSSSPLNLERSAAHRLAA